MCLFWVLSRVHPKVWGAGVPEYQNVVVIGAGIVGVSTAIWLQRQGVAVTLIDREGPASGTSYGNAGILAAGAIVPVVTPGLWKKAPGMLLNPGQPLFLRWSYLPQLFPFLIQYMRNGSPARVEAIATALHTLLGDSPDQHQALTEGTDAADLIRPGSYLYGYTDRGARDADAYGWDLRAEKGATFRDLDSDALAAYDPALKGRFGHAVELVHHGVIVDPGLYVLKLAAHFEAQGGTISTATLTGFRRENGQATAAQTDQGDIPADGFVVTTGVWSQALAKSLGVEVPVESERGYHIEFHRPNIQLKGSVMVAKGKFAVSPMEGRMRAAGVVEFGGTKAGPSKAPFALLRKNIREIFPDLEFENTSEWMGHRPSTSDSLPVIGPSPKLPNVYFGYGHQHVGLTGGPKTGRWLAQMMTGAAVNEDLSAYSPARRS